MAIDDVKQGSDKPKEPENLSATAMFLRGFESPPNGDGGSAPPSASAASQAPPAPSEPPASTPGEFTRLFQAATGSPDSLSANVKTPEAPPAPAPPAGAQPGPGEFTRIFVAGSTPPASEPVRRINETPHPIEPASPIVSRSQRFSSPGSSDSVSGEGAFTQLFKSASAHPLAASFPAEPIRPSHQEPASVTSLLSSLSSASSASAAPIRPAPEQFRPDPKPAWSAPAPRPSETPLESGGVTRLIQQLANEPAPAAPPPPAPRPVAAPVNSGPGEFTRMISSLAAPSASVAAPSPSAPSPAAAPPAAPPIQVAFHAPAPPAVPAPPPAPRAAAPIAVAPPPPPKLAPAPPVAAPKGKLDAISPLLLIVNTFLLLAILLVLLLQARGH